MTTHAATPDKRSDLSAIPAQQQEWPGAVPPLEPTPDHGEKSWTSRSRLEGLKALITGGDSGIGRATAIVFAQEGADVAITHLAEEADDAEETKKQVESHGGTCVLIEADLREVADNVRSVAEAVEGLGGLDILVANAAFQMAISDVEAYPKGQIERTFATNVFSPFWLVQEARPHLAKSTNASITVTTSIQAMQPSEHLLDYAATKAALNNLVVNLASQLGEDGIRVNAVAPGPIWTPLIPATMPKDKVKGFGSDTPLGRAGHPVEVAAAYVFLASDEASYVSGTVLGVTGGKAIF